eukprot:3457294-Lingulodinium_polyedra.AAC.1
MINCLASAPATPRPRTFALNHFANIRRRRRPRPGADRCTRCYSAARTAPRPAASFCQPGAAP